MEVKEGVPSIKQRGRMLYIMINPPSKDCTRKDNFRTSRMHCTDYKHGTELWMKDGLNAHMEQS